MSTKIKKTKRPAARTEAGAKKRAGHHEYVHAVEKHLNGERVIAGPFLVEHASPNVQKEERVLAVRAFRAQKDGRLVMHQGRAFVVRPIEGWKRAKQSTLRLPVTGEVWLHAELGRVAVTSVTSGGVDYCVLAAEAGHRNKVAPVRWFAESFEPEVKEVPISQAGKYQSLHTRTTKITQAQKLQRLKLWLKWHRHGLRGAVLEKRSKMETTQVRKWSAELEFDLEGRA
jgi:hypothetical protein